MSVAGRRELAFDGAGVAGGWTELPVALARLNLEAAVGEDVRCSVTSAGYPTDAPPLADLVAGAGFLVKRARRAGGRLVVDARRDRTLPDFVGGGMRMLVCGLNPSVVSADLGFGYPTSKKNTRPRASATPVPPIGSGRWPWPPVSLPGPASRWSA